MNEKTEVEKVKSHDQPSLIFCLFMDAIGYVTYAAPFIGEVGDLIWAPLSAFIFYKKFGGTIGMYGGIFNFIEEILPGLDFIPTFSLVWLYKRFLNKRSPDKF
jgi:hypothetical protein